MLAVATVLWGAGFTWAKAAGEGVHRAIGLPDGSMFGPVFVLAWRFLLGGVALLVVVPAARRGWSWGGVRRSVGVGVTLAAGLIVQHLGLDRTSEAVSRVSDEPDDPLRAAAGVGTLPEIARAAAVGRCLRRNGRHLVAHRGDRDGVRARRGAGPGVRGDVCRLHLHGQPRRQERARVATDGRAVPRDVSPVLPDLPHRQRRALAGYLRASRPTSSPTARSG